MKKHNRHNVTGGITYPPVVMLCGVTVLRNSVMGVMGGEMNDDICIYCGLPCEEYDGDGVCRHEDCWIDHYTAMADARRD